MKFCCHAANGRFNDRLNVGEFLIAGVDPKRGDLRFYCGFTACHKADWKDLTVTCYKLGDLMREAGASNFKLCAHHIVKYCSFCGVDLAEFYGLDGGALRDDEFLKQLKNGRG
ncbi:hypothetical protein JIN85_21110 [Luteolibacter pohnpeiensis]|uniref:Uncharacterized protein n=2 Tax=Luteolibacter pohnpeiensis TaxID=454153 RepID=A0A934SAP9_9BACT|nr:hypothetical protein [Luteolibacter pohnpeiensis]